MTCIVLQMGAVTPPKNNTPTYLLIDTFVPNRGTHLASFRVLLSLENARLSASLLPPSNYACTVVDPAGGSKRSALCTRPIDVCLPSHFKILSDTRFRSCPSLHHRLFFSVSLARIGLCITRCGRRAVSRNRLVMLDPMHLVTVRNSRLDLLQYIIFKPVSGSQ